MATFSSNIIDNLKVKTSVNCGTTHGEIPDRFVFVQLKTELLLDLQDIPNLVH